jgi:hypothetical protein
VEEAVHRAALNRQALARLAEADSFARLSTKRSKGRMRTAAVYRTRGQAISSGWRITAAINSYYLI